MKRKIKFDFIKKHNKKILKKFSGSPSKRKELLPNSHSVALSTDYEIARKYGINERLNMKSELNGIVLMHILNKIKEIELKDKVASGKKIKVAFFLDSVAKFPGANVCRAMENDDLFESFVVLYGLNEARFAVDYEWQKYLDDLDVLRQKGYKVFAGYDDRRNFIDLENFQPDIVFVSPFYLDGSCMLLSQTLMDVNFLVCQLNYGFNVCNSYEYHYNNRQVNTAWKYFVETREDFSELRRYSMHYGLNAVYTGSPKMDTYALPLEKINLPPKIDNGKPIIIYAPHWTVKYNIDVHDLATFDLYKDCFMKLAHEFTQYNFVFKPHPCLEDRLSELGIMTKEEYNIWIKEWNDLPNGLYVSDDSYMELFRKSDLLITDSGSFIFEWLPTRKPCMYLVNPRRDPASYMEGFSILARKILETYYLCHNEAEIESFFTKVMINGDDPLKSARLSIEKEIFPELGNASKKIIEYLRNTILG